MGSNTFWHIERASNFTQIWYHRIIWKELIPNFAITSKKMELNFKGFFSKYEKMDIHLRSISSNESPLRLFEIRSFKLPPLLDGSAQKREVLILEEELLVHS